MADEPSLVARRIQEVRVAKKLSRQQLADRLGITYLQVYRIETGAIHVTVETATEFADALKVDVASLLRESRAAS